MILAIKTSSDDAELYIIEDNEVIYSDRWSSKRQLEQDILIRIKNSMKKTETTWQDIIGLVIFAGPGSFTGLRIGFAVFNTLSFTLSVRNVSSSGDSWLEDGVRQLSQIEQPSILVPEYGGQPNITKPKK